MKRTNVFFIAILLATAPFVSTAANANDQEIKGLLQKISVLVSEIDGTLASLRQSGAYTGIVAGATSASASEIIIDNTSLQTKKSGTWCVSAASNFYGTDSIYSCGSGADIFSWIPSLQESAKYEVFMWWTQHPNRSVQGLVQIVEEKGTVTQKLVNQQINGGEWNSLGVYSFGPATGATAGSGGFVKISDQYGQVAADAVKFVKVDSSSSANTITSCGTLKRSGNYVVDRDLSASTEAGVYCLNIVDVNDIHIDCQNHNISGGTLINISSVNNFSLSSCTLTSLVKDYPSLYIEKSSNGTINNNTFNSWSVFTTNSSNLKFLKNNFNAFYSHIGSKFINIAENVFNPPQLKGGSGVIALARGSNNSVVNNSIDAKSNGLYGDQIGFDDGIIVEDETSDFVQGNTILNSWDCGIETSGFVSNSKFVGNTIKNHGFCGIGGWYWNSLKNNVFSNNSFDDVGSMFQFFRSYGLRSGPLLTGPDYPYDTYEYFQDNVFEGNKLLSLKQNPVPSFVNQFSPQIIAPLSSGTAGERMITEKDQIFSNNVFRNNDFGAQFEPPKFAPKNMVVDGGGNQCGPLTDSSYPLQCGKSVSSLPTLGADVYYIEDDGTILQSDGRLDIPSLTRKFYKSYPDKYDFLTFYSTFVDNYAPNYHIVLKNDVEGIGMSVSLDTSLYGSAGKLRGVSILRNFVYSTVIHETAHQFLAYVPGFVFRAHWDQFIDLSFADGTYTYVNSPMGAAMGPWVDNGNGTFSEDPGKIPYRFSNGSGGPAERFNDSELYLMGLMPKFDVKPLSKLVPTGSQQIVDGKKTYPGYKVPVSVEQLIQAAGSERNPAYPSAPKDFTMAFIVLTKKGEALRDDYITNVNRIAKNFSAEWSFATRGKSTVNGATSVTPPPPPSAPTISLSASPLSITSGQSSTLIWSSTDATSCTASGAWSGTKGISGSQAVNPTITSTYTLTCTGSGGSVTQSTTVTVSAPPPPPPSTGDIIIDNGATGTSKTGSWCVSFASDYYGKDSLYSCGLNTADTYRWAPSLPQQEQYEVSMWWTQHPNRSTNVPVKILANIGGVQIPNTVYVNQQANGGKWNSLGTFLFGAGSYVEVSDKNGQANADAVKFVKVVSSTPLPVPTVSFSASPSSITSVQSSTLTWISTSATSCTASGAWSGTKTISGIQVVNPTITSTYTLICTGGGGSATNSVTITVSTAPSASLSAADITSNFEMGSGFNFVDIAPNTIQIDAELENGKTYTHTPYFKIQQDALNNSPIFKIRFGWGGYHSYLYNPAGTPDTPNASWVYSYDNINWVRFPAGSTHYDLASDAVTMQSPVFTQNTVYISPLIPYGYTIDYMSDKARWVANPNVTFSTLGTSVEGRSIELFTITNVSSLIPEASKKVYFIIRSGHPIEQHTSWRLRGMIDWVLSNDPEAIRFRDKAILKATFNANVDGWVAGSFRTNAHGQDMNRDYEYTGANPALEEPETYAIHRAIEKYMATNHIDVFMDMHDSSSPSGGEQLYRAYSMPNSTSLTQLMTTINGLDTSNLINNGINSYHYPITTYTDGVYGQYASRGVKSFMTEGGASFHQNGSYVTKASSEEVGRILIKAFFKWLVP